MEKSNAQAYWSELLNSQNLYGKLPETALSPAEPVEFPQPIIDPESYNCVWINGKWVSLGCWDGWDNCCWRPKKENPWGCWF